MPSYVGRPVTGKHKSAVLQRALNDGKRVRISAGQAKAITARISAHKPSTRKIA